MTLLHYLGPGGESVPVSAANPMPASDAGAVQAADMSATAPVTWDAGTSTIGITTDTAGGVPVLDGTGLIKLAQMPISGLNYHGNWDAAANSPALADGAGAAGDMYRVHVAGTQDLGSGSITFEVGDLVVYEGAVWQKFEAATGVISVNGQTGAVSLTKADVGLGNVDNTADADKPVSTATQAELDTKLAPGDVVGDAPVAATNEAGIVHVALTAGSDGQAIVTENGTPTWGAQTANAVGAIATTALGVAGGVATLGADATVPADQLPAPAAGVTGARPASPATGASFFDITLTKPIWWSGAAWVDATGTAV